MTVQLYGLGEITASEDALNALSETFRSESRYYEKRNWYKRADLSYRHYFEIWHALYEKGYYND